MSLVRYTRNDPFFSILDDVQGFLAPLQTFSTTADNKRHRVNTFDDRTEVSIAAPGIARDSFTVNLEGDTLTIGYKTTESDDSYFTKDSYTRSWKVDRGTTAEDISATHTNGVLTVTVVKATTDSESTTNIPIN